MKQFNRIHFMGVGGSGASAAAGIADGFGFTVSGCDRASGGHSSSHIDGIDLLCVSPAVLSLGSNNQELLEAGKRGVPIMTWQKFLGAVLLDNKFVIAVCGTHGKSTTTAMISKILEEAGLDPTCLIGASVLEWGRNFRVGKSRYFVVEADEFNDNFLEYAPDVIAVTNMEMDHPEYFDSWEDYVSSFGRFFEKVKPGGRVIRLDGTERSELKLGVFGDHNIANASLALKVADHLEIEKETALRALENFSGLARRMELIGEAGGVKVYDDYGHHPTEVRVTLEAFRKMYPNKRITLVYQPHMYSRTYKFLHKFVEVFEDMPVGRLILTDIYGAREKDTSLVSSLDLVKALRRTVEYIPDKNLIPDRLSRKVREGDVVIFMGAGDISKISKRFLNLKAQSSNVRTK